MPPTPTFGTPLIGQTEKALNAILHRQLAGTGLTEPQWVTLTLAVVSGGSVDDQELTARVAGALKVSEARAEAHIDDLADAQLLQAPDSAGSLVTVTGAGQQLHSEIRAAVTHITERLWGDLPPDDLETAARVLSAVHERANAELVAA